jgi:hypothetical protein
MPTDAEHATMRRLLNEAMDAGACGWSAQRLVPNGPSAVQRDFDGSPMNTDLMHDETCIEMAKVLGQRGEGFQELTLSSWDPKADAKHFETLAEISGRPIMFEAIATQDRFPHRHRNTIKWLERCRQKGLRVYGQGVTTDAGLSFTFEDWNLFDDSDPNGRRDQLWDRDVAEAFLQPDPSQPHIYKEFEVSPNGMWIDLDIGPGAKPNLNSGMTRSVYLDQKTHTWAAELAIPMRALTPDFDPRAIWRVNFFRCEGKQEPRGYYAWQPTHSPQPNFHVPAAFGRMRFEAAK